MDFDMVSDARGRRRSMRAYFVLAILAVILLVVNGCGSEELTSRPKDRDITIDGAYEDWQGALEFVEDADVSVGLMNDGEFLYIALVVGDRTVRRQIMMSGLYLWFDPEADEAKRFGIRYPIGLQEDATDIPAIMREQDPEKLKDSFQEKTKEMLVVGHGDQTWRRTETGSVRGVEAAAGGDQYMLVLEYKVPIGRTGQYGYGIGSEPGAVVGVGLETPEIDFKAMREQMDGGRKGGGRGGMGGGMPGGGGGMRGNYTRSGGQRPEMPDPIKLWAKVGLAANRTTQ